MKTLIATLALGALVATCAVAKQPAYPGGNYPCPEYNRTDQTCGVHKENTMRPNSGRQNGQENIKQK
jgi:hypothetical protein